MRTTTRTLVAGIAIASAIVAGACRQADGPIPTPTEEQPNKIHDIGRDLQNIAGASSGAEKDLLDDLDGIDATRRPAPLVAQLASSLNTALKGKNLADAPAQAAAQQLFVVLTARQLSPRQIEQLGRDLHDTIVKGGADSAQADRVASVAVALQSAITTNHRRWYQIS